MPHALFLIILSIVLILFMRINRHLPASCVYFRLRVGCSGGPNRRCGSHFLREIAGIPVSTVHGHAGELVLGHLAGVPVACMKGRGHFYEGRGMAVMTDAIRTLSTGL